MAEDKLYPQQPILMIDDEKDTLSTVDDILRIAVMNNALKLSDSLQATALMAHGS